VPVINQDQILLELMAQKTEHKSSIDDHCSCIGSLEDRNQSSHGYIGKDDLFQYLIMIESNFPLVRLLFNLRFFDRLFLDVARYTMTFCLAFT